MTDEENTPKEEVNENEEAPTPDDGAPQENPAEDASSEDEASADEGTSNADDIEEFAEQGSDDEEVVLIGDDGEEFVSVEELTIDEVADAEPEIVHEPVRDTPLPKQHKRLLSEMQHIVSSTVRDYCSVADVGNEPRIHPNCDLRAAGLFPIHENEFREAINKQFDISVSPSESANWLLARDVYNTVNRKLTA